MRFWPAVSLLVGFMAMQGSAQQTRKWAVVLHGGAGTIDRKSMDPKMETAYKASLNAALQAAAGMLAGGGKALDAVEQAIKLMEDDPLFNAGRGAVFTAEGKNELDSSIMDGATLAAGAVAGVTRTRHPISLARAVMEKTPHVLLMGPGADAFGREAGLEQVDPSFFFTERRWEELVKELEKQKRPIPARPKSAPAKAAIDAGPAHEFGTTGVVALDRSGNVAAGTSTGGMTAKRPGRVGDSPIIGAGTYASNESCAVSGTGTGEYFIRLTIAREICALVQYRGMSLQAAADELIQKRLGNLKGGGGVIAIRPNGEMAWSFNTSGMYRARLAEGGKPQISIYAGEP
jgi:L-asparaginase / beta-aspartyl-peptidase